MTSLECPYRVERQLLPSLLFFCTVTWFLLAGIAEEVAWLHGKESFWVQILGLLPLGLALFMFLHRLYGIHRLQGYGSFKIRSYAWNPNPGKTMLSYLGSEGVLLSSVSELKLMVCNLSDRYLYDFLEEVHGQNSDLLVTLYGIGTPERLPEGLKTTLIRSDRPVTEHINVIRMKNGKVFVWHEPKHTVKRDRTGCEVHSLPFGAYLLETDDEYAVNVWKQCSGN